MIDAHCHLDLYPEPKSVAQQAAEKGVFVVSVTTTPLAWSRTRQLADAHATIVTALGMHPQLVGSRPDDLEHFEGLVPEAEWLGEIGIDGSPDHRDTLRQQVDAFRHILTVASRSGGRVLSIHSRSAPAAVLQELRAQPQAGTAVLHWFSGSRRQLREAIDLGCWFSINAPMLRSERGRALIQRMPKDRLLTETDGPFVQTDGTPSYPWDMPDTERMLAELWREPHDDVKSQLWSNLRRLPGFGSSAQ